MTVFGAREKLNVSHIIHAVSFGEPYPDMVNPLDNRPKIIHDGSGYFQYYIKVVPTIYEPIHGWPLHTNQYSYTELFRTTNELDKMPGERAPAAQNPRAPATPRPLTPRLDPRSRLLPL